LNNRISYRKNRGAALIVGLILLVVLTLLGVVGMNIANSELAMATNEQLRVRAFQAAETGIEQAVQGFGDGDNVNTLDQVWVSGVTSVENSPLGFGGVAVDSFNTTSRYRGQSNAWNTSIGTFSAFHFDATTVGSSARSARAEHIQGAYVVNVSDGSTTGNCTVAEGCTGGL
jgi:type IV pilus assembly protein PilX